MPVLEFDSGDKVGVGVEVTQVGFNLYRVDEITTLLFGPDDDSDESIAALPNYRDVIYAERGESNSLKFVRVQERSGFVQRALYIPAYPPESAMLQTILGIAKKHGGASVVEMGGVYTYAVPESQHAAFVEEFDRIASAASQETPPK